MLDSQQQVFRCTEPKQKGRKPWESVGKLAPVLDSNYPGFQRCRQGLDSLRVCDFEPQLFNRNLKGKILRRSEVFLPAVLCKGIPT